MPNMKAVQIRNYKNLEDFALREVPVPRVTAGEVLVKVEFAGINPSDLANSQGYFAEHTVLPRIIGRDFVGKVVEGPSEFVGHTVMGSGGDIGFVMDGTFAEYVVLPKQGIVEVPTGLELPHAASLGVPFLAALACLNCFPRSLVNRTLLIIGGAGAVGSAATIIARERGARVVRTILRQTEIDALSENLKSGDFIDLSKTPDIVAQTKIVTKGEGFDFVINMVGGRTFEPSLNCLKEFGQLAVIASPSQPRVEFNLLEFYRKNLSLHGLNTALDGVRASATRLKDLFAEFEGKIDLLTGLGDIQLMPFTAARTVLERALAKELRKPVFQMSDMTH